MVNKIYLLFKDFYPFLAVVVVAVHRVIKCADYQNLQQNRPYAKMTDILIFFCLHSN